MNNCWVHYSYNCFKGNAVRIFWCVGFLFSKENADTYQKRSFKRCKSTNMYSFLVWSVQYWNSTAAGDGDGWNYASQSTQKVDTVYTNKFPSSLRVKGKGSISACPLSQVSFFPWLSWYHTVIILISHCASCYCANPVHWDRTARPLCAGLMNETLVDGKPWSAAVVFFPLTCTALGQGNEG